jgi:uncharacterized protein YdaT
VNLSSTGRQPPYVVLPCASISAKLIHGLAQTAKQLKCIPFPNFESDNDVAMSDASSESDFVTTTSEAYHTRLASNASTSSSDSSASSDSIDGALAFFMP